MYKKFSNFNIGQIATFHKVFTENDFKTFLKISGDNNSLHWDKYFAKETVFKKPIVPLQLTTAPLSKVAGMIFPGKPSLFLTSNVKAIKPIFYEDNLIYSARIESISSSTKILGIRVLAIRSEEIVIDAFIKVKVLLEEWEQEDCADINFLSIENKNQTYLITGSTGEIGSAISLKLAKKGFNLILLYRNNDKKLQVLKDTLKKLKASFHLIRIDLDSKNFKNNLIKELDEINFSSGISGIIHTASPKVEEELEKLVRVNYSSLVDIVKILLPKMLIRHKSSIVFISSTAVTKNIDGWQNYIAAKIMTTNFLAGLNTKFSNYGLKCTTLMPGFVQTDYSKQYRNNEISLLPEELADEIINISDTNAPEIIKIEPQNKEIGFYQNFLKLNTVIKREEDLNKVDELISKEKNTGKDNSFNISMQKRLNDEFKKILNIEESLCNEYLTIENNPNWDSLNHFQLIASIESQFAIKFDSSEISILTNYSSLLKIVLKKLTD